MAEAQLFAALAAIAGIITGIFWMIVGWRAMRAHERIAESLHEQNNLQRRRDNAQRPRSSEP